jgi:hypothetical protein
LKFYFYNLTIFDTFFILKNILEYKKNKTHFYIYKSTGASLIIYFLDLFFNIKIQKLDFKLKDIRNNKETLIKFIISSKDSFDIMDGILKNYDLNNIIPPPFLDSRLKEYIKKNIIRGYVNSEELNIPKILYVINVISQEKNENSEKISFVLKIIPFESIISNYASKFGVNLVFKKKYIFDKNLKDEIFYYFRFSAKIFTFLKSIFQYKIDFTYNKKHIKVFIEGRGNVNLGLDEGDRSDLFLLRYNKILPKEIAFRYNSRKMKKILKKYSIYPVSGSSKYHKFSKMELPCLKLDKENFGWLEVKELQNLASKYYLNRAYWYSLFKNNNIKVHLTWFDNNADHMAIADGMRDFGGIASIWQTSFYGFKNYECITNTDILFNFSKFDYETNISLGSKNKYNIITGFIFDYSTHNINQKAIKIKNRLLKNGAKKIINVMDENCSMDERWHTGISYQRENYNLILKKVLDIPWLGVIFKPKKVSTLIKRLGPINEILNIAIKTGRCIILDQTGSSMSLNSPLLASMVADISVHAHLFAGTAAIECALHGKKTLLIDRESTSLSKLQELPRDSVIYDSWEDAINEIIKYFENGEIDLKFGNWSNFIEKYDMFKDSNGSHRMSFYINELLTGFKLGYDRDKIMDDASEKYADKWGVDKVYKG